MMKSRLLISGISLALLFSPGQSLAQEAVPEVQPPPKFLVEPSDVINYEPDRNVKDTKKYIDPISPLASNVDLIEFEALRRRVVMMQDQLERQNETINALVERVNLLSKQ